MTGAEEAGMTYSLVLTGFSVFPCSLLPAPSTTQGLAPSHPHSMHTLCSPPWPWHQWGPLEPFFYMHAPKARAPPKNYFPGNIWVCSLSVVQPECCASSSVPGWLLLFMLLDQKTPPLAVCPLIKLPHVDGRVRKRSAQATYSMFKWIDIKFWKGIVIFFFPEVETTLWVGTRNKCHYVIFFFYYIILIALYCSDVFTQK